MPSIPTDPVAIKEAIPADSAIEGIIRTSPSIIDAANRTQKPAYFTEEWSVVGGTFVAGSGNCSDRAADTNCSND